MLTLLTVVHLMIGLALVLFVLLQDPKGGAMGVFSGGSSSSSFFGASGATNFLTTVTRWLAIAFAASCLTLTYVSSKKGSSVMDVDLPAATPASGPTDAPSATPSSTPAPSQQTLPGEGAAPKAADQPAAPAK